MFSQAKLRCALIGERFGHPLYYFPTIGSTNDEAKRLAAMDAPEGTLIVADEQTAGRGRSGHVWITPRGKDLASTFVLRPAVVPSLLSHLALIGGLAASQAIESVTGLSTRLKWPNDVCVSGRKVCGVLAETSIRQGCVEWVALGIGINVNLGPPAGIMSNPQATSLAAELGRSVDRLALLVNLSRALAGIYPNLGLPEIIDAWEERMLWHGRLVRVLTSSESRYSEGVLLGLNHNGALRLQVKDGTEVTVSEGEVRLVES